MRKSSISIFGIIALLFSVLTPVNTASAADVTKTVTIQKSDGSAYPNVLVSLVSWNQNLQADEFTAPTLTDASGVASIVVNGTTDIYGIAAQPQTGDVTHAPKMQYGGLEMGQSDGLTLKLAAANVVVTPKRANGSDAGIQTWLRFPSTQGPISQEQYVPLLRTGNVGLDIQTSASSVGCYGMAIWSGDRTSGDFEQRYGLKISQSSVPSIYSEIECTTALTSTPVGSLPGYTLQMSSANLQGSVLSSSGAALSFANGLRGTVDFFKAGENGEANFEAHLGYAPLNSSAEFVMNIQTPSATTKIFPVVHIAGSNSIPSFFGAPFWVDSSGRYSTSENGTYELASTFRLDLRVPSSAPNLAVKLVRGSDLSAIAADINLYNQTANTWFGPGYSSNGLASYVLPDGQYNLNFWMTDRSQTSKNYRVLVSGGVATVTTQSGEIQTANSNGVYVLSTAQANLAFRVVDPNNPTVAISSAWVDLIDPSTNDYIGGDGAYNGIVYMSVEPGTYKLQVNSRSAELASNTFDLVVTSTGANVSSGGVAIQQNNGAYSLPMALPNVTATIKNAAGEIVGSSNSVNLHAQIQKKNSSNNWQWTNNGAQVSSAGRVGFKITEPGTYRVRVQVNNSADYALTFSEEFNIAAASDVRALGDITLKTPNFKVRVRASGSSLDLIDAHVNVFEVYSQGSDWMGDSWTQASGLAAYNFDHNGNYQIQVEPPYDNATTSSASKRYDATVTGCPSACSVAVTGVTAGSDGVVILSLGTPNITGKILSQTGTAITFVGSKSARASLQRYNENGSYWDWIDDIQVKQDGTFGFAQTQNGTYRVRIEPYGIAGAYTTVSDSFVIDSTHQTKDFGNWNLREPGLKIAVRTTTGTSNIEYANVEIRKDNKFVEWIQTGQSGVGGFTFTSAGTYQLTVRNDNEIAGASSKTYVATVTAGANSGEFNTSIAGVTAGSDGVFVLRLGTPNVTGKLVDSSGATVTNGRNGWVYINAQKQNAVNDSWDWTEFNANVKADGTFGLNIETPGTYRLRIDTYGRSDIALTYSSEFTITSANASTFSKAFGNIVMKSPTLKGVVKSPDGTTNIQNAQVIAINNVTGQEMWDKSANTDKNGAWSMSLPSGSYSIYARAPYRSLIYGNGEQLSGVTVASDGTATISGGADASALSLRLSNPTWSGTLLEPGNSTTPVADANVCLALDNQGWTCTQTDSLGKWALSKPKDFAGFNNASQLIVTSGQSKFPELRLQGEIDIEAALGNYVSGSTYSNITLRTLAPNTQITVMAGSSPAQSIWVTLERPGTGWLGSGMTDENGVARFNITSPTTAYNVRLDVNGNKQLSQNYASTAVEYTSSQLAAAASNGVTSLTTTLATPNLKGYLYEPGVTSGTYGDPVAYNWIEFYNQSDGIYGGGSTNSQGYYSLYLAPSSSGAKTYRVTARSYNSTKLLSSHEYTAVVASNGTITLVDTVTNTNVTPDSSSNYKLTLRAPSVTGEVVSSDNTTPVQDSWIQLMKIIGAQREWINGTNSNRNGAFGLGLDNGTYEIEANAPWNTSDLTKSERCTIQIENGALTNSGSCVANNKVKLSLRAPNLSFTLKNGNTMLTNSHVSVSLGNWYTWAQADKNGKLSLFIDTAEIAAKNPGLTGTQKLNFWFDPPYGSSQVVRWNCQSGDAKPVCDQVPSVTIGQAYTNTNITAAVQAQLPNTTITVKNPDGSATVSNSGVSLFRKPSGQSWYQWVGYANSDLDGKATFNVENETNGDLFMIDVQSPWNQRGTYAQKRYSDLTFSQLNNQTFRLSAPNLKLALKQPLSTNISRWSHVSVEEVDSSNYTWRDWVGGYGSDYSGIVTMFLGSSKTFKITAYPGYGSDGTTTTCFVSTDSSGVVSIVSGKCSAISSITNGEADFSLSAGNLTGTVTRGDTSAGVDGVIIYAEAFIAGTTTNANIQLRTSTKQNGQYGMLLDSQYDWKVKVFYVNRDTGTQLSTTLDAVTITSSQLSSAVTQNFALTVVSN